MGDYFKKMLSGPETLQEAKKQIKWGNIIFLFMWILIFYLIWAYNKDVGLLLEALKQCESLNSGGAWKTW
jgi:hypothetical protein